MIDRSVALHGALAVLATALAFIAWQNPRGASDYGDIELIPGKPEALARIAFSDAAADIGLTRRGEEVLVSVKKKAKAPPDAAAATSAPPAAPEPTRVFPGTAVAKELFTRLAPFSAVRTLGAPSAEQLESFGLATPEGKLELEVAGKPHTIEVGKPTFGGGAVYIRPAGAADVYLVKAALFNELKNGANGLLERALVVAPREKIETAVLSANGKKRELVQRYREDRAKAFYADPAEPDAKLTQVSNWLDRLMRVRMLDFVEATPSGEPLMRLELFAGAAALARIEIWSASGDSFVARSSAYAQPVTLAKLATDTLLKDLEAVLNERP